MSVDVASAYLGAMSRETFLANVAPSLQALKMSDGIIRYDRRDLDAWVDARGCQSPKRTDSDWLRELNNA